MSERSKTARYLMAGRSMTHEQAEAMVQEALDEHAHELAEKIREEVRAAHANGILEPWLDGTASDAADLIDPEVE